MRKKWMILFAIAMLAFGALAGCGTQKIDVAVEELETSDVEIVTESKGNNKQEDIIGIRIGNGTKYQYKKINSDDVIVVLDNGKEVSLTNYTGDYVTDSSIYMDEQVGIVLGDKHYSTKVDEFIFASDITWSWDKSQEEAMFYARYKNEGILDTSWFEGYVEYTDGTGQEICADSAKAFVDKNTTAGMMTLALNYRGKEFKYEIEIKDHWGDGMGEGMYADESKEDDQEQNENLDKENSGQEETVTVICRHTEYNSDGSIEEWIEYEYTDAVLTKSTEYNSSGNIRNYIEYEYGAGGELAKTVEYIPAFSDGHMYRGYEYLYESGNKVQKTEYDGDGVGILAIYEYKYDSQGNLTYSDKFIPRYDPPNNRPGWTEYSYDEFGGLIEIKHYDRKGALSSTSKYEYEYNKLNKPMVKYMVLSDGEKVVCEEYAYDSDGIIVEINSLEDSKIIRYEYNSDKNLIKESTYWYNSEELLSWIEYEYSVFSLVP